MEERSIERPSEFEAPILVEHAASGISSITFNRPQRLNALDWPAMERFAEAVAELGRRCAATGSDPADGPRVVVLTGAGGRAFCSGGDQHALHTRLGADEGLRLARVMGDALLALERLPIPSVAAVDGFALGGGSEIALACDLRVVSEDVKFGLVHLKLGLVPGWGAGQRLLRLVGHARAAQMLLAARPYSAAELLQLGLVNHVTLPRRAYATGLALAEDIAAADPSTVRAVKQLLLAGRDLPYAEALDFERTLFPGLWAAEAHVRSVDRFMAGGKNA
ncbi:MAG: enoyl-CoA hydratase/isomerase family protein [Caldilineae bacterium]|nr:enoyl-CoA hydratase/isomerase family protein [Chloroflexota bacterium]MCB9176865.1 enoyl-CoA hydratase/isomerase family protein [Caldilineae bacterium]